MHMRGWAPGPRVTAAAPVLSKDHFLPGAPATHTHQPRPWLTSSQLQGRVGAEIMTSGLYAGRRES